MSGSTDRNRKREYNRRYYAEHKDALNRRRRQKYGELYGKRPSDGELTGLLRERALYRYEEGDDLIG